MWESENISKGICMKLERLKMKSILKMDYKKDGKFIIAKTEAKQAKCISTRVSVTD